MIDAYLDGLAQAKAAGHDLSRLASVASFFVSRVDTAVDERLETIGGRTPPRACAARRPSPTPGSPTGCGSSTTDDPRWRDLAAAGALPQRPLWASTGVKDPAYPDTRYVDDLVAPHTVNTMPGGTLEAVGRPRRTSTGDTAPGATTTPTG